MINLSLNGLEVLFSLLGLASIPFVLILLLKITFNKKFYLIQGTPSKGGKVKDRTKYPQVSAFALRKQFLTLGLILALGFALLAFSWKSTEDRLGSLQEIDSSAYEEILTTPPIVKIELPPPPPPLPKIEEIPDEVKIEEEFTFVDQTLNEKTPIEAEPTKEVAPPPPPPPAERIVEPFFVVEDMPLFPGCETTVKADRKKCSEKMLFSYLSKNLKYPSMASDNRIEGRVILNFVVEKDGSISNIKVVRGVGGGCDEAAIEAIENMPKWTPGKQRGRPVRVSYTLPVYFLLK